MNKTIDFSILLLDHGTLLEFMMAIEIRDRERTKRFKEDAEEIIKKMVCRYEMDAKVGIVKEYRGDRSA